LRAARELGPAVFVDGDEIWNTERMTTDEEWIAFAGFLRAMVRRKRLPKPEKDRQAGLVSRNREGGKQSTW
jgi:hypothetical protein